MSHPFEFHTRIFAQHTIRKLPATCAFSLPIICPPTISRTSNFYITRQPTQPKKKTRHSFHYINFQTNISTSPYNPLVRALHPDAKTDSSARGAIYESNIIGKFTKVSQFGSCPFKLRDFLFANFDLYWLRVIELPSHRTRTAPSPHCTHRPEIRTNGYLNVRRVEPTFRTCLLHRIAPNVL